MRALGAEDLGPEFEPPAPDQVARLVLEHLVVVRDADELVVTEALGVGNVGKVRVALLAVLSNDERVVDLRNGRPGQFVCELPPYNAENKLTVFSLRNCSGFWLESM